MPSSLDELRTLIQTCPVIDNHGHNILRPQQLQTANFITITTEAGGDALEDTPSSLAHLRAVNQLRDLYSLPDNSTWDDICRERLRLLGESNCELLFRECFKGTETILIDDGLDTGSNIQPYSWHDQYTQSPCKRIVRIEAVASEILSALNQDAKLPVGVAIADEDACHLAWLTFITAFERSIITALSDSDVVGFKSVICYRTGLDIIPGRDAEITEDGLRSFRKHFLPDAVGKKFRIAAKGMNDALVISTCKLIAAHHRQKGHAKPLQFHTGLGDNDISLLDSNPACLQPLIAEFETVPIVLLHSSYPYTREAGYLAACYKNAFLDIGEVFPMVSRDGQEKIIRQALELTPSSKLLWSTDGHHFPETYWLANKQGREAIEAVICEYVEKRDLTLGQAAQTVKDFLFNNSNRLYNLKLELKGSEGGSMENKSTTNDSTGRDPGLISSNKRRENNIYNVNALSAFTQQHGEVKYTVVQWLDFLGTWRSRILPWHAFLTMCKDGNGIGISRGNLGTTQNDQMTPKCNPVGQIMVQPDLRSLRPMHYTHGPNASSLPTATVMSGFTDESGSPLGLCPRSELQRFASTLKKDFHVTALCGFEIEITFCRRVPSSNGAIFEPIDTNHAWGTFTDEQYVSSFPLLLEISETLRKIGIDIEQLHAESGPGQYEIILPPSPPDQAVDTLVQARQCIQQVAAVHGLRATCHPMPFPGVGSGSHSHISLNKAARGGSNTEISHEELSNINDSFFASVLEHLPAICAFTLPQAVSYNRIADDSWTGGTWVGWGTQNREAPLRKLTGGEPRWELRCLDGTANMYLALAAIFAAGLDGIRSGKKLLMKDLSVNPTKLSNEERTELGITQKMPTSLEQALEALEKDEVLDTQLSTGLVEHFVTMKRYEQDMLNKMSEPERRIWIIERY